MPPTPTILTGTDQAIVTSAPFEWRDEATVAVNPTKPANIIAASTSSFGNQAYALSFFYSFDGGRSWAASAPPKSDDPEFSRGSIRDAVLQFSPDGTAYACVGSRPYILRSTDGGVTWSVNVPQNAPSGVVPWFACDPTHPGRLFVAVSNFQVISDGSQAITAYVLRSDDGGVRWRSTNLQPVSGRDTDIPLLHVVVGGNDTVHAIGFDGWRSGRGMSLMHWRSVDGGRSFAAPQRIVEGTVPYSTFPSARVTACLTPEGRLVAAWLVVRDGLSRVYYRATDESGARWQGPVNGQPLSAVASSGSASSQLRPLLAVTGKGAVGCAYYDVTGDGDQRRAQLMLAVSLTGGDDFETPVVISDSAWDVSWGAGSELSDEDRFGKYFGLAADTDSFLILWPDARTGSQALYFDRARVQSPKVQLDISDEITIHLTSERWLIVKRRGDAIEIIRVPQAFPPRPPRLEDVTTVLGALEASNVPGSIRRIPSQGAARALVKALAQIDAELDDVERTGGRPA